MHYVEDFSQYIIYGANGWLGRSALKTIIEDDLIGPSQEILLIGSRESIVEIKGVKTPIIDSRAAFPSIREGSCFYNAAFLRREKINALGTESYISQNNAISEFAELVINSGKISTFINISSGAASSFDTSNDEIDINLYGYLKKNWEERFAIACKRNDSKLINCRVYSVSGLFINEFNNLAISSFIKQAKEQKRIEVRSPATLRTLIDGEDLARVLFRLAKQRTNVKLDSGGCLVSLLDLAKSVAKAHYLSENDITKGSERSSDYFGNYQTFNALAFDLKLDIKDIDRQVSETLVAFNS